MNRDTIVAAVVGLIVGVLATGFGAAMAVNNDNTGMMRMMGMKNQSYGSNGQDIKTMPVDLALVAGDEFDKEFLAMMITHHQGAIDMAKTATANAKHEEIKVLGQQIIDSQTNEISQMSNWLTEWGYAEALKDDGHGH